jgi:hypothetical protein
MLKKVLVFFDKLEDKVRKWLSPRPLTYALIGGTGVVLFWRGIWHTTDFIMGSYFATSLSYQGINSNMLVWWDGPLSMAIGLMLLLITGIFTSIFIGNEIIISGIKGEKKTVDKTEMEIRSETESVNYIKKEIETISSRLKKIEAELSRPRQN